MLACSILVLCSGRYFFCFGVELLTHVARPPCARELCFTCLVRCTGARCHRSRATRAYGRRHTWCSGPCIFPTTASSRIHDTGCCCTRILGRHRNTARGCPVCPCLVGCSKSRFGVFRPGSCSRPTRTSSTLLSGSTSCILAQRLSSSRPDTTQCCSSCAQWLTGMQSLRKQHFW